jgi:hypothetical protein
LSTVSATGQQSVCAITSNTKTKQTKSGKSKLFKTTNVSPSQLQQQQHHHHQQQQQQQHQHHQQQQQSLIENNLNLHTSGNNNLYNIYNNPNNKKEISLGSYDPPGLYNSPSQSEQQPYGLINNSILSPNQPLAGLIIINQHQQLNNNTSHKDLNKGKNNSKK